VIRTYANRDLRPVEVLLLVTYQTALAGRVLELGCGAGRLTGYLSQIASYAQGVDLSPEMVAYCRSRYPSAKFDLGDLRDVAADASAPFNVIVAGYNVLDVLNDDDRGMVLDRINRSLCPGGLLIMSSHNRANIPQGVLGTLATRGVVGFVRASVEVPLWVRNRRRLIPFERDEAEYAIRNDISYQFGALHYYITRDAQERQFNEHGFRLLECLDLEGRPVNAGQPSSLCSELHYVAQVASSGPG
jgi:SAM-dependent methyltransferase